MTRAESRGGEGSGAGGDRPSADEVDARIGKLVDERYRIVAPIAAGSMGVVYRAEREPVGKLVAIKFLHSSFAREDEFLIRFERETQVMSKLSHPNCVSVVDFGVWEGAPYLVMEHVSGRTLRQVIDEGPLSPQRALLLTRQIAAGLAHAHAQGVVHRDIKPANIMISEEPGTGEHLRILDFGLARLRGNFGRDATQANVVVGTPNYMAPEQTVAGTTLDARTDLYAVGCVLFEMIAGQRPYAADDTMALLGMHRAAPIPRLADRIERTVILPEGVQGIIDRAMAKAPAERFQGAVELAEAIDAIVGPRITGEQKVVSPRARAAAAAAAADGSGVSSTIVDVGSAPTKVARGGRAGGAADEAAPRRLPVAGLVAGGLVAAALAAGVTTWYLRRGAAPAPAPSAEPAVAPVQAVVADVAVVAVGGGSGSASEGGSGDGSGSGSGHGSGSGDGSGDGSGSGGVLDEIEMDPMMADNPDPAAGAAEDADEAADAPSTTEDAEKRLPDAPVLATTVREAVQMLKDGRRDDAFASLRALWRKSPDSAYIPFLLGNIYNDRLWWSVALDHYRVAIIKNGAYRGNAVLNRNVIRMLGSGKTQRKASAFLRTTIGKPGLPYLKKAAKTDRNPTIRTRAAALAKQIR